MVEDSLDGLSERFPQVSDESKEDISGNVYYKTINGGIIRSVKPPHKNNGEVQYKVGGFCYVLHVIFRVL